MGRSISREMSAAAHLAFRQTIPELENRTVVTLETFPLIFLNFIPLVFLSYLARRPDTHLIRLLLLPTAVIASLRIGYAYQWKEPTLNIYNAALAMASLQTLAKTLDLCLRKDGLLKIGEVVPGSIKFPSSPKSNGNGQLEHFVDTDTDSVSQDGDAGPKLKANGTNGFKPSIGLPTESKFPAWIADSAEVMFSLRGLGFKFGQSVRAPRETRSLERNAFLWSTFKQLLVYLLYFDLMESILKLAPGVGSPYGGTIFPLYLPPAQRYLYSTVLHFATGGGLIAGFNAIYGIMTLVGVGLLGNEPSAWPPVMDNPWISQSVHEFWARRWHQQFRQTFIVLGGYPGQFIGGKFGFLFGVFFASGAFHEFTMITLGRGWDTRPVTFFLMQAMAICFEKLWRRVTGKRVGGWLGTIWVYSFIVVGGQSCVDSWHRRGLGGGTMFPPQLSLVRHVLFPGIKHILSL